MGRRDALKPGGGREEALEHLSSWEKVFWEMLQDQKGRGERREAEQADGCSKLGGRGGPRRVEEALR